MKQQGFTLIELMIATAIVAILASIAVPAYSGYIEMGHRFDAKTELIRAAMAQERWRTRHPSYANNDEMNFKASDRYSFSVASASNEGYLITATPKNGQTNDPCGLLSIDENGELLADGCSNP